GPVAGWSQLGIYRLLAQLPAEQIAMDALHPALKRLLLQRDADLLIGTLECYLDRGCDLQETATRLVLHRSSLYNRLRKIENITQVSLNDGETRLALHLGLKLARLAGLYPHPAQGS